MQPYGDSSPMGLVWTFMGYSKRYILCYDVPDHSTLGGTTDLGRIELHLRRIDTSKMLLRTRGFHWISEEPYNR